MSRRRGELGPNPEQPRAGGCTGGGGANTGGRHATAGGRDRELTAEGGIAGGRPTHKAP